MTAVLPELDAEVVEEIQLPCDTTYRSPLAEDQQ